MQSNHGWTQAMKHNAVPKPFLLARLRRARWLSVAVLPFFLLSAVESSHAVEVLAKEKAKRNHKQEVARKQGMDERFLLDPDAYLKQTLRADESRRDAEVE